MSQNEYGPLYGKSTRERILYALSSGWDMTLNDFVFRFHCDMKTTDEIVEAMVAAGEIKARGDGRYYRDNIEPKRLEIDVEKRPSKPGETWGT